eukprot:6172237-Pleurochrysis_carterae.AAC.1
MWQSRGSFERQVTTVKGRALEYASGERRESVITQRNYAADGRLVSLQYTDPLLPFCYSQKAFIEP